MSELRIAFVGNLDMGGMKLRGIDAAKAWLSQFPDDRVEVRDIRAIQPRTEGMFDAVVVVKYTYERASEWRRRCRLMIWDSVDSWMREKWTGDPGLWFSRMADDNEFDRCIVTVPSAVQWAKEGFDNVSLLPHSADERCHVPIVRTDGDVFYFGGTQYLGGQEHLIHKACEKIGRTFRVDDSKGPWRTTRPVACVLHFRLGEQRTPINLMCKPQVKLANAGLLQIPILATGDPCVTSMDSRIPTIDSELIRNPSLLAHQIDYAIHQRPPDWHGVWDTSIVAHARKLRSVITNDLRRQGIDAGGVGL